MRLTPSSPKKVTTPGTQLRSPAKLPPAIELPPAMPASIMGGSCHTRLILPSASRDGTLPSLPRLGPDGEPSPQTPTLTPTQTPTPTPTLTPTQSPSSPGRPDLLPPELGQSLPEPQSGSPAREKDWFSMLAPDADEEALDLLIAHVAFVTEPVVAFVRCAQSVDAGCESHVPVRYLFLLIGPEGEETHSIQMAHALAGMMLDEPFVAAVADCTDTSTFFAVFDHHLSSIAILPHVHAPHVPGPESPAAAHELTSLEGQGHRTAPASSESAQSSASEAEEPADQSDDEDDVILGNLEDHLRSTKGMPKVPKKGSTPKGAERKSHRGADRNSAASHTAGPGADRGLARRPSFADIMQESPLVGRRRLGGEVSPSPGDLLANVGALPSADTAGLAGLGASSLDALSHGPAVVPSEPVHRRMFIELEQCIDGEWVETHHWNWAFEQEVDGGGGGWCAPHLPTISARALVDLFEGLSPSNVLLDLEGASFAELARPLARAFVQSRQLASYHEADARAVLTSRSSSKVRTVEQLGSVRADVVQLDLSPEVNEEAFAMLVAHTDVVKSPAMAFARLATPIQLGCEKAAPVRFIFTLLAPPTHRMHSVQLATAFAAIMLDMDFAAALRVAADPETILDMLRREMECITIVPHSRFSSSSGRVGSSEPAAADAAAGAVAPTATAAAAARPRAESPPVSMDDVKLAQAFATAAALGGASFPKAVPHESTPSGALAHPTSSPTPTRVRSSSTGHLAHSLGARVCAWVHWMQRLSLPLILGIVVAVAWANLDPTSYNFFVGADYHLAHWGPLGDHTYLVGHKVTLHFLVNDIFMVFFFGIAAKEVTEACLPGGSLNPLRKALSPLVGTVGGVMGPILVYLLTSYLQFVSGAYEGYESSSAVAAYEDACTANAGGVDSGLMVDCENGGLHRRLAAASGGSGSGNGSLTSFGPLGFAEVAHGWGVPTATDISLAWMVAMQVFPQRHPGIEFLLLLAVADDAIGLIIIAIQYKDPLHPTEPIYLLYVLLGMLLLVGLRAVPYRVRNWWPLYILLGGVPCWFGLISARLHPALALVFVVPFLPSTVAPVRPLFRRPAVTSEPALVSDAHGPHHGHDKHAPLHAFEHSLKLPIDLGMFFFTLCNAGVRLEYAGPLTMAVFISLLVGKLIGIACLVLLADRVGCAPLNARIKSPDVAMLASTASIGLTVALFIAGEAYEQERLKGEAKLGALLSGFIGLACVLFARTPCWSRRWKTKGAPVAVAAVNKVPTPDVSLHERATPMNMSRLRSAHYDYDDVADIVAATLERSLLLSQHSPSKHGGTLMQTVLEDDPAITSSTGGANV
jgi:Na+/H+ antiporter NhaA/mannitol/fructose-specific phosphotransferase system IIA component (Ntr-type)